MPNVIGKTEKQARAAIGDAGLAVGPIDRENSDDGHGRQGDPAGPRRPTSTSTPTPRSTYVISLGKPAGRGPVRDRAGQERRRGRRWWRRASRSTLKEEESDEDKDIVIRTDPSQGTTVAEGTTIVVYFSDGREKVPERRRA